ncbi:adenosylcobinamide kinase /adenosylcobinamide-phosphate guanylyltransferase [Marininema mesophilum]|uniref:Adenosylcobinamide kinase n=1 Tax=Marininema mesophilum TaxID=1048340 RepID=A0A1H2YHL2_9BACL|nr:bifunctional adenosylcobinamide kinase/adenosylcobinamide-phosphate guanylyltransferase [Marininema mesophilum]SDX04713.1 adenosylcobinamide kinase /adenosylcobinamide-phosphate guanylyltransferase [Marininema mesophilum]
MIRLITGGIRSGKSAFAEKMAQELGERVLYVATGAGLDEEMEKRIQLHRNRRPFSWGLVEEERDLPEVLQDVGEWDAWLIDDLATWVANDVMLLSEEEMKSHRESIEEKMLARVDRLLACCGDKEVILVTSEVGHGGVAMNRMARLFQDLLGRVNQRVANEADQVWMVVSGIPVPIKGGGG